MEKSCTILFFTFSYDQRPAHLPTEWLNMLICKSFIFKFALTLIVSGCCARTFLPEQCGVRPLEYLSGRIVGGHEAWFGQVPWQTLIVMSRIFGLIKYPTCGGVLIGDRWILTAAHCNPGWLGTMQVILGTNDNFNPTNGRSIVRRVKEIHVHPNFNRFRFENDIALIELRTRVRYSKNVQPICLPYPKEDFTGKYALVSGWGHTQFGNLQFLFLDEYLITKPFYFNLGTHKLPKKLQVVEVPILERDFCHALYAKAGFQRTFPLTTLCAGYPEGKKDSCTGDSGGPLMIQREDNTWVLAGIVSNGIRCAEPNLPGIYTKITPYINWIQQTTSLDFLYFKQSHVPLSVNY